MSKASKRLISRAERISWGDGLAGLSVALIAIPQALAYAELAGLPAHIGLYALAFPTIAAAFFASSPYLQTGPVATTSLLSFGVLSQLAEPLSASYVALAGLLALIVGLVRVLVGVLNLGSLAFLMSRPVLQGFISAAAILICLSQLPSALGVVPVTTGVMNRAQWALLHPNQWDFVALLLCLTTITIILLGRRIHPLFPGVLLAAALGLTYSTVFSYSSEVIGSVPVAWPSLLSDVPWAMLPQLFVGGSVIALIGFAEAASIARTYAAQDRMRWQANREFVSQGVANLAAGIFGAFPVGGSFGRSSINRLAGAKTRWSGAVTGLVVLAFLPFIHVISPLPLAVLAGIVIAAVWKLINLKDLLGLWRYSKSQAYIAWVTFSLTLILSPRIDWAILIGVGLAIAHHLRREQRVILDFWAEGNRLHFRPQGVLWFGSAVSVETAFTDLLADYPDASCLVFDLGGLGRIDLSAAIMLGRLLEDAKVGGLDVELVNVPPMAKSWVERIWKESLGEILE